MNRNIGLDILRILACFMVVGIHTTPIHINNGQEYNSANLLMQAFYRAGLPIFFLLSGFFLINKKWNVKSYIYSIIKITIPFIIISLAHYIYLYDISPNVLLDYIKTITTSITGVSVHFWFVYVILALYIFSPIITVILSCINEKKSITALLITLIIYAFISNYPALSFALKTPEYNFKPGPFVWVVYFIFGGLLARCSSMINIYTPIVVSLVGLIATYKLSSIDFIDFRPYDINATMLAYSSAILITFLKLGEKIQSISNNIKNAIISISDKTYIVYLVHIMVLDAITTHLPEFIEGLSKSNLYILLTLTCFVFSLVISFLITPIANRITWLVSHMLNVIPTNKINSQLPSSMR
ncbi:acyltransferase [Serratia ureilytica]|uniref:acyltransferase n=1 Tax=Serratia ureilytica TaxID=300181 RepID=UPI001AA15E8F|nr:acyltransferase [Serratia ureilytica]